ncbi:MAG: chorismate lyase [Ghiorsea sp.]|nr:chorismate lyase [Ghiorsea sp.]
MIQDLLHNQTWMDVRTWRAECVHELTPAQTKVLSVVSPLTSFLEREYALKLDVHVHDQFVDEMSEKEAQLLKVNQDERCFRRKVSLLSRGKVMFDAESILPVDLLPIMMMAELEKGKRPLANLLSDQGLSLSRSNLSIVQVKGGFYTQRWARSSVLGSNSGVKALVTEVFHDAMWLLPYRNSINR